MTILPSFELPGRHPCLIHRWNVRYDQSFGRGPTYDKCPDCRFSIEIAQEDMMRVLRQNMEHTVRKSALLWRL